MVEAFLLWIRGTINIFYYAILNQTTQTITDMFKFIDKLKLKRTHECVPF